MWNSPLKFCVLTFWVLLADPCPAPSYHAQVPAPRPLGSSPPSLTQSPIRNVFAEDLIVLKHNLSLQQLFLCLKLVTVTGLSFTSALPA